MEAQKVIHGILSECNDVFGALSCFVAVDDGKTDFVVSPTYDVQK
jgi:hypothetical protein